MTIEIKTRINVVLSKLPYPATNEKHLCPCYEQLIGAAYGLISAGDYGILNRSLSDYHERVRPQLVPIMTAADRLPIAAKNKTWATWVSGFYFNTAIQRIIWATDRLVTIFAALPLSFNSDLPAVKGNNPNFF